MRKVRNATASWLALLGVIAIGAFLTGCRTQAERSSFADVPGVTGSGSAGTAAASAAPEATAPPPTNAADPAAGASADSPDTLKEADSLIIIYNDLPQVVPPFEGEIKPDGTITLILNKTFTAAGKTVGQLEKEIRDMYVPDYFKNMTVTVKLKDEKRFYYVGGEVRTPGRSMYLGRITVLKAIQSSGGFTDFARKTKVQLIRADGKRVETINCVKANEDPALDLEVYPGDRINVPRRFW